MRNILIISCLFSISTMAATTLRFTTSYETPEGGEATQYVVEASFTGTNGNPLRGEVHADTTNFANGCTGTYVIDFSKPAGQLSVTFDGIEGRGTTGGCHDESMEVDVTPVQYKTIMSGQRSVDVNFRSLKFGNQDRTASVVMINFQ